MRNKLAALAALFLAVAPLHAADNATIDVIMSIQVVDVTGLRVFDAVAVVVASSKVIQAGNDAGRAVFTNTGNGVENFSIRIASTTGTWTPFSGTTAVPQDQYRLRAVWSAHYASTSGLNTSDFNDNDILTTSNQLSSGSVFWSETAATGKVGTFANNGGTNIPVAGVGDNQRHLFFRWDSGAAGTLGSATSWINVTASAAN